MDTDIDLVYWALQRYANHLETNDPLLSAADVKAQLKTNPPSGRKTWLNQCLSHFNRATADKTHLIGRLRNLAAQCERGEALMEFKPLLARR